MTPKPYERLSSFMDARRTELGLTWRGVAEAADITVETLRAIRRGTNEPSPLTRRGIERALSWAPGSIEDILQGGEPTIATSGPATIRTMAPVDEDDPRMQRAAELLAEAAELLNEIRRERREGA